MKSEFTANQYLDPKRMVHAWQRPSPLPRTIFTKPSLWQRILRAVW